MIVNRIVNRIEIPQEKGSSPSERNIRAPGDKAGPTNRVTRRIDAGFFVLYKISINLPEA